MVSEWRGLKCRLDFNHRHRLIDITGMSIDKNHPRIGRNEFSDFRCKLEGKAAADVWRDPI